LNITKLLKPNRAKLGSLVAGTSGSGKTTAMVSILSEAIRSDKFGENHRFVIIDPKVQAGDYDKLAEPVMTVEKAIDSIHDNRTTVYWPDYQGFDQVTLQNDVSRIIDHMFEIVKRNPEVSITVVIDEASILITPNKIPSSIKRLSVQGRAKNILPIYISQRPLTNRWLDSNVSNIILFRMLPIDADNLTKRWGVDFEEVNSKISNVDYSFVRFDLEKSTLNRIKPVDMPKKIWQKKKTKVDRFFEFFRA
tara:strand:+ start:7424 stop:8173 length:750 start_codon:yes stop_codon:yes gene_type:complete